MYVCASDLKALIGGFVQYTRTSISAGFLMEKFSKFKYLLMFEFVFGISVTTAMLPVLGSLPGYFVAMIFNGAHAAAVHTGMINALLGMSMHIRFGGGGGEVGKETVIRSVIYSHTALQELKVSTLFCRFGHFQNRILGRMPGLQIGQFFFPIHMSIVQITIVREMICLGLCYILQILHRERRQRRRNLNPESRALFLAKAKRPYEASLHIQIDPAIVTCSSSCEFSGER